MEFTSNTTCITRKSRCVLIRLELQLAQMFNCYSTSNCSAVCSGLLSCRPRVVVRWCWHASKMMMM